jgi:hypothetical protein
LAETYTPAQAAHDLEVAIEYGDLMTAHAPGGHPLFGALDFARAVLSFLQENADTIVAGVLGPGMLTRKDVDDAIQGVHAAVALIRDDGSQPTQWPTIKSLPWPWIAGGVGALVVVGLVFRGTRG